MDQGYHMAFQTHLLYVLPHQAAGRDAKLQRGLIVDLLHLASRIKLDDALQAVCRHMKPLG